MAKLIDLERPFSDNAIVCCYITAVLVLDLFELCDFIKLNACSWYNIDFLGAYCLLN